MGGLSVWITLRWGSEVVQLRLLSSSTNLPQLTPTPSMGGTSTSRSWRCHRPALAHLRVLQLKIKPNPHWTAPLHPALLGETFLPLQMNSWTTLSNLNIKEQSISPIVPVILLSKSQTRKPSQTARYSQEKPVYVVSTSHRAGSYKYPQSRPSHNTLRKIINAWSTKFMSPCRPVPGLWSQGISKQKERGTVTPASFQNQF